VSYDLVLLELKLLCGQAD